MSDDPKRIGEGASVNAAWEYSRRLASTVGPLLALGLVWLLFAILVQVVMPRQTFATIDTSLTILLQTAVVGTAAIGATLIIVSGGIDLSVGSTIALGTMVVALTLNAPVRESGPNRGEWHANTQYAVGDVLQRSKGVGADDVPEFEFYKCHRAHLSTEKRELGNQSLWVKVDVFNTIADAAHAPQPGQGTVEFQTTRTETNPILWPMVAALAGIGTGVLVGLTIGAMVTGRLIQAAAVMLAGVTALWLWPHLHYSGLAVAAGVGAAVWFVGGRFVGRIALTPFIATLGLWGALRGVAKGLGDNQPINPKMTSWLKPLMWPTPGQNFLVPTGVWITLFLGISVAIMLRYTRFGRHIFAIGSNELTARLCGIRVERTKLAIYMFGVGCAGLAAVLQFGSLTIGDPTTAAGFELKVIAAVVIGGASLTGGTGSILGTIAGALIMTVVAAGCTKLNIANWVQEIVTGAIIVTAVGFDEWRKRKPE